MAPTKEALFAFKRWPIHTHTHVHDTQLEGSSIDSCMQTYIDVCALKYVQIEVCAKYAMATRLLASAVPRSVLLRRSSCRP